jgi:hypothetical protein
MTAYEHAVKVGRGWVRLLYDYISEDSDRMHLVIKRVPNLFSVYPDPASSEHDYSDMRWCIVTDKMDKVLFETLYPNASAAANFDTSVGDRLKEEWYPGGMIRIAEYWWVEVETRERFWFTAIDPQTGAPVSSMADGLENVPEGAQVRSHRKVDIRKVYGAKVTGSEILETWEWPGKWIPIVPVLGREYIQDGKRLLRGMIRPAMDANLHYDYLRSREAQAIGLAPIAPWLIPEGAIEGYEVKSQQANRKQYSHLEYKTEVNGRPVPPPTREVAEPPIQAITQAIAGADNDIKATLSTYDASLGNAGPESSGRAIIARQREGDNAHFHYADNLARSMRHMARMEIDLIPDIYTQEEAITINNPDGQVKSVEINTPTIVEGVKRLFNLRDRTARYDVVMGTGPSYASRRQQGADALMQILPMMPIVAQRAPDLVLKALDVPDTEGFAERVRPPISVKTYCTRRSRSNRKRSRTKRRQNRRLKAAA